MTNQLHTKPDRLRFLGATLVVIIFLLFSAEAEAEVVRFEVLEVESPTFEGRQFGSPSPTNAASAGATRQTTAVSASTCAAPTCNTPT